jgi:prolyl oligopeptidase
MDGPPGELFFDPNLLSEDGTISLAQSSFTESGKLWAYGLSKSVGPVALSLPMPWAPGWPRLLLLLQGSDWSTVYVRSTEAPFKGVEDASKLDDVVQFVKFSSVTWTHDEKGFFYQRFPTTAGPGDDLGTATASDKDAAIYYHRLGTDQAEDELVHKDETNPEWMFGVGVTTDGQWALLSSSKDTAPSALLSVARLEEGVPYSQLKWKSIVSEWGAAYS